MARVGSHRIHGYSLALQEKICESIRAGMPPFKAAERHGVPKRTHYGWVEKGESQTEGIYFDYVRAINLAESDCMMYALQKWKEKMGTDWRAPAQFLKVRWPDLFGERSADQAHNSAREVIVVQEAQLTEKEWQEITGESNNEVAKKD